MRKIASAMPRPSVNSPSLGIPPIAECVLGQWQTVHVPHPHRPCFDLPDRTPRLELRVVRQPAANRLANVTGTEQSNAVRRHCRTAPRHLVDVVLLLAGIAAPLGLLAVNGAVFIVNHLAEFRLSIGIAAVLSSLALSGLTAHTVLGRLAASIPDLYARCRLWMIGAAVVSVVAWSLLGGWGAYQSMSDARSLPNIYVVLTALWLLALPFVMSYISRRLRRAPEARDGTSGDTVETPSSSR